MTAIGAYRSSRLCQQNMSSDAASFLPSTFALPSKLPAMSTPEQRVAKPQRVLACVLCQQRKIKCERRFPCSNCVKSGSQCVPAALIPRQRRRRFPERELLERLRQYEDLLRQHNIRFEPLHKGASTSDKHSPGYGSPDNGSTPGGRGVGASPKNGEVEETYNVFETK